MVIEIRSKVCERSKLYAKNNLQLTSDLSLLYLYYFHTLINNLHLIVTSIYTKLIIVNMCYHFSHTSFGKFHLICLTEFFCLPTRPPSLHLKPLPYHYFTTLKVGGLLSALCFLWRRLLSSLESIYHSSHQYLQ